MRNHLFCLALVALLAGCQAPPPRSSSTPTMANSSIAIELASSLIDDALDLMPPTLRSRIAPDNDLSQLMQGVSIGPLLSAHTDTSPSNLGRQVAAVVSSVYGPSTPPVIPRIIFYTGLEQPGISGSKLSIPSTFSENERYSIALTQVVNLWLLTLGSRDAPKIGIYLRDGDSNLYLYEAGE